MYILLHYKFRPVLNNRFYTFGSNILSVIEIVSIIIYIYNYWYYSIVRVKEIAFNDP